MLSQSLPQESKKKSTMIEVRYSDIIDQTVGNIIKANQQFMDQLCANDELVIEGQQEQDLIFATNKNTFKMKGINLPTSIMVAQSFSFSKKENQPLNSEKSIESRSTNICFQTSNYLKIEPYNTEYHKIYPKIVQTAIQSEKQIISKTFNQIVLQQGHTTSQIKKRYKMNQKDISEIIKYFPCIKILNSESPLGEDTYLFGSIPLVVGLMRILLPVVTAKNLFVTGFTFHDIQAQTEVPDERFLQILAKQLDFEINSSNIHSQGSMEQQKTEQKSYRINLPSILRFIILEIAINKYQLLVDQMDQLVRQMCSFFVPSGIQEFNEEKIKLILPKIIAKYFFTAPKNGIKKLLYYNPLMVESSIKSRISFMTNFKNRFTYQEVMGIFDCMVGKSTIDLSDVIMKHFRKYGDQYQIKLIMPK